MVRAIYLQASVWKTKENCRCFQKILYWKPAVALGGELLPKCRLKTIRGTIRDREQDFAYGQTLERTFLASFTRQWYRLYEFFYRKTNEWSVEKMLLRPHVGLTRRNPPSSRTWVRLSESKGNNECRNTGELIHCNNELGQAESSNPLAPVCG